MGLILVFNENFKLPQQFHTVATQYLAHGISVLPVWGMSNPELFKVAATNWKTHQRWFATDYHLGKWYREGCYQGIGVICGRLSQLLVIDFDNLSFFRDFCEQFPQLTMTYIVKTPNGWHVYFHIPAHVNVQLPTHIEGLDIQWEGRYVVAPPTHGYIQHHITTLLTLSETDLTDIGAWMTDLQDTQNEAKTAPARVPQRRMSAKELASSYRAYAREGNRNNTLFQCACLAHNMGWSEDETYEVLRGLHVEAGTDDEKPHNRYREATLTISSAFKQDLWHLLSGQNRPLPNTITEAMHKAGHTCAVQVLSILRNNGHEPGTTITRPDLVAFCRHKGLSYHTIKKTISLLTPDGGRLLTELDASDSAIPAFEICDMSINAKPSKSQMGRPPKVFRIPTDHELAEMYDCGVGVVADYLPDAELVSAKRTRMAAHRAFIARKPGMHRSTLLAERLGVSKRTKNRYDNAIPDLHKRPVYAEIPLHKGNLWHIPREDAPAWLFLEDETGKRYPPIRGLAGKLLKQGRAVRLCQRMPNYYWVGTPSDKPLPTPLPERAYTNPNAYHDPRPLMVYWQEAYQPVAEASLSPKTGAESVLETTEDTSVPNRGHQPLLLPESDLESHNPRIPFADPELEFMTRTIQHRIHGQGRGAMDLRTVRQRILRYGSLAVWRAMRLVEVRDDVRDVPAFLTAYLKERVANTA